MTGGSLPVVLVDRLRSELDRLEAIANAAAVPSLHWAEDSAWLTDMLDPLPSQRHERAPGWQPMITPEEIKHIAANDPATVLRTIQAHRKIIDDHQHEFGLKHYLVDEGDPTFGCTRCHDNDGLIMPAGWCVTVLALASIYFPESDATP